MYYETKEGEKGITKRGNKDGKQNFATGNFKGYQILTVIDIVMQKTPQKKDRNLLSV